MKEFIKKNAPLTALGVLVILSLISGISGYFISADYQKQNAEMNKLPWVVPLTKEYDNLWPTDDGKFFEAEKDDGTYLMDSRGNIVSKGNDNCDYPLAGGMTRFSSKNDYYIYGVKNKDGKVIAEAKYDFVYGGDGGYVLIEKDSRATIIDENGNTVLDGKGYREITHIAGTYYLLSGIEQQIFNAEDGSMEKIGNRITYIYPDGNDGYIAQLNGWAPYILLDKNFKPKNNGQQYNYISTYSNGLYYAEKIKDSFYSPERLDSDYEENPKVEKGYMDETGEMIIPLPGDTLFGYNFSEEEDKAIICTTKKIKIIDRNGKVLSELKANFKKDSETGMFDYAQDRAVFKGGYAPVDFGKNFGIIDTDGNMVLEPKYSMIRRGPDNCYAVSIGERNGIINLGEGL